MAGGVAGRGGAVMFGDTRRAAERASDKTDALSALTLDHMKEDTKRFDQLAKELADRERAAKADDADWRAGVGRRFDKQDHMNGLAVGLLITTLLSIIGSGAGFVLHLLGKL